MIEVIGGRNVAVEGLHSMGGLHAVLEVLHLIENEGEEGIAVVQCLT